MKFNDIRIDICVATFKRPHLIIKNLQSLLEQKVRSDIKLRIIVIDNDVHCSAKNAVEKIKESADIEIIYDVETCQNIAAARNKALTHVDADYFVCVDDDEQATDGWLMALLDAMEQYKADIVFGPVEEKLPDNAPAWISEGGYFGRKFHNDGAVLKHGATNNVLIKTSIVDKQPFDKDFGLTGGSDTELFHKLYKKGYKLTWCNKALVREDVVESRLNLKWLLMRSYRGGQVYIRVYSKYWSGLFLTYWYFTRLLYSLLAVLLAVTFLPISKTKSIFYLRKAMGNIGQLTGKFGLIYKEYTK